GDKTMLQAGDTLVAQANVMRTGGHPEVTWATSGPTCPAACGTLVGAPGGSATYSAPQIVGATFTVTLTATLVIDRSASASVTLTVVKSLPGTCPSGNESALAGDYAFLLRGGGQPGAFAAAGTFVADGAGNVTSGLEDENAVVSGPKLGRSVAMGLY